MSDLLNKVEKLGWDAGHIAETLNKFPENTWISPTNANAGSDYSVFSDLLEINLVCTRRTPVWVNSENRGAKVEFKYNHNLQYDNS